MEFAGMKVTTVLVLSSDTVPATVLPLESFTVNDTEPGTMGAAKVAVGATETGLLDEPA
jgi:hypothetical protein